jgi:quinohemoprotein ethanol dehydrogenase
MLRIRNVLPAAFVGASLWLNAPAAAQQNPVADSTARYVDSSDGRDWAGYGRTFGQQHYSPLAQISSSTVRRLGLVWSLDLEPLKNTATQPIAVDAVLYFATGLSVVHAVDATTGKLLWSYDPKAAEQAGLNLRHGWGVRGIAWWNGKIYTGTVDGRLIAIDAKSGKPVWSVQTFEPDYPAHINGAPRVFDGKVIIGYASSTGATRGYVTTYDAQTGQKLWRFDCVPGNPAEGFENQTMEKAAQTWTGEWWKHGGGGADVWNAIAYDPQTDTVFLGTGSAYVHNRKVRSADWGDNLFVSSIIALDGKTGAYKWHYQTTPGDTWDFDAVMDIELADLTIGGKVRKVLLQAPKNGFFYVIDRVTGELISAEPYAKVTWANRVDLRTGRPIENSGVRYPNRTSVEIWPSAIGAHSWMPMAYNPTTQLAYIPKIEYGTRYTDKGIDLKNWRPPADRADDFAMGVTTLPGIEPRGALLAWNPITQKPVWEVSHPTLFNGGILTTGGGLVFQGTIDGKFKSYSATTGRLLWSFDSQAPLIGTPITYTAQGNKQYVTVLTGLGMGILQASGAEGNAEKYGLDPRSQRRRVLTFSLDGQASLAPRKYEPAPPVSDPGFKIDEARATAGEGVYNRECARCHGPSVIAAIQAPDLRRSGVPLSEEAFASIVRDGGLVPNGMPAFGELTDGQLAQLRQYIRAQAQKLRPAKRQRQ